MMLRSFFKKYQKNLIYVEAVLYMLLITFTIFASFEAPIYLKFIPLTFLLGIAGIYIFEKKLITAIFGFCIAICVLKLNYYKSFNFTLVYSLYVAASIYLGELLGGYFKNMMAKRKSNKNPKSVLFALLVFVLAIWFHISVNGNIFSFLMSETTLQDYLNEKYEDSKLTVFPDRYIPGKYNIYTFYVKGFENSSKNYKFSVTEKGNVVDGYFNHELEKLNQDLMGKLSYLNLTKIDGYDIKMNYSDFNKISLLVSGEKEQLDVNNTAKQVNTILNQLLKEKEFSSINKMIVTIKHQEEILTAEIAKEYFQDLTYYENALSVEYFD